jgi:hypothetical protein
MILLSQAAFAEIREQLSWLRIQNDKLTEQIVEMKRDGFARATPQMAHEIAAPMDDRIMAAIRSIAPEGSRLEGELMQFANAALLADEEIEDIADRILAGSPLGDD